MKIGILSFNIVMGSGQSRFAVNLSVGLKKMGVEVSLFAYSCDLASKSTLTMSGLEVYSSRESLNFIDMYRSISDSRHVFTSMLGLIRKTEKCDYYLVLSDELIGISGFRTDEKWVYLTNGDMIFLYLNERFLAEHAPFAGMQSMRFVSQSLRHQKFVKKYDAVLANSRFTAEIMSFFFDYLINDYVYPPVDTERFNPLAYSSTDPYALVLLRSNAEPLARYIEKLSKTIPIKIVGQTFIEGAITLGKVSDDQLISAYSNAAVTISASLQEFFGYSTAESLACGTPVISFNYGGAAEMLVDGFNGWLVKSEVELSNRLKKIFDSRYSEEMRANARNSSDRFSLSTSATKFIELLRKIE